MFLALVGITGAGIASGVTTPSRYQATVSLREAELDGKALFHSTALGTNGLSCDSCHVDGGRFSHKLGAHRIPSLVRAQRAFPAVDAGGNIHTLESQIDQCIVHNLEGKPLPPQSRRLGLLDLYIRHLSHFHER